LAFRRDQRPDTDGAGLGVEDEPGGHRASVGARPEPVDAVEHRAALVAAGWFGVGRTKCAQLRAEGVQNTNLENSSALLRAGRGPCHV